MNIQLNFLHTAFENLDYLGMLALIFLAAMALALAVIPLFGRRNATAERLAKHIHSKNEPSATKTTLLEVEHQGLTAKVAKPLHDIIAPAEGATKKRLRLKLIQGGFRSERAIRYYLASKVLLGLLFPIALSATIFYSDLTPIMGLSLLGVAALGFFTPNLILSSITRGRKGGILRALPDALDLMVVCVEAGLGLDLALKRVGEEMRPINRDLADEFHLTNLESRAGRPRTECLKNMGIRTGVAEIQNLMTLLIQSSRFGSSLAKTLRVHADAMRIKRRQSAEEKAAKSVVMLLLPLILCIFPAIFVVLVGPAGIKVVQSLFPHF